MKIEDFINFLNKYTGKPTAAGMEKFFKDEVVVSQMEDGSCNDVAGFDTSGNLNLCIDTLEKLTSDDGWALVTPYNSESMKMILITPKMPNHWLMINDVKSFNKQGQELDYAGIIEGDIEVEDMKDMPPKTEWGDISVGGSWFDTDEDWNYTYLSRFFTNNLDFNDDDTKAWLVQFTYTGGGALPLLNWMFSLYDSLFELVGIKV